MTKKVIALEHQDSVTSSIRENRIQLAVQDAYQRANSIAQATIDRLEQDKARLEELKKQELESAPEAPEQTV